MIYIINYKTYRKGTGKEALKLSKIMEEVSEETGEEIVGTPQPTDLYMISKKVDIPIFSQHIDPIEFGSHTGWILPEAVKEMGVSGTLLNHSERKIPVEKLKRAIKRAKELNITTVVCCETPKKCAEISEFRPDYIAIEPPELIGSGIPVSKAQPEIIKDAKRSIRNNVPLLCGAGINDHDDVERAEELGAEGVLVASAIVKADDRKNALLNLVR
ncbi:MAG: triose-phosphate isomerase [Candidatus Aenigmatarchaeota archaeon]